MAALTADRNTAERVLGLEYYPLADNVLIYKGSLVCIDASGYVHPAADTAGLTFVGFAETHVDNTVVGHAAGLKSIQVRSDRSALMNGSSLTQASVGQVVYALDDNTVGLAASSTHRIAVGVLTNYVSATSGWVTFSVPGAVSVFSNAQNAQQTRIVKVSANGGTDTAGGLFAWQNPEGAAIIVTRLVMNVTTASTAACLVDIGTTAVSAVTLSDNLLDGVNGNAIATYDNLLAANAGTNGLTTRTLAAGGWVTGSTQAAGGASAGMVANAYIDYILA